MTTIWGLPSLLIDGGLLNSCRHYELCFKDEIVPSSLSELTKVVKEVKPLVVKSEQPQAPPPKEQPPLPSDEVKAKKKVKRAKEPLPTPKSVESKEVPLSPSPPTATIDDEECLEQSDEQFSKELTAQMMDYYSKWTAYVAEVIAYEEQRQQQLTTALVEQESKQDEPNPPGFTPPQSPQPFTPESGYYSNYYQPSSYFQQPLPAQWNYWDDSYNRRSSSGGANSDSDRHYYYQPPPPAQPPDYTSFPDSNFNPNPHPPFPTEFRGYQQEPPVPPPPENSWLSYNNQAHYESGPVRYNYNDNRSSSHSSPHYYYDDHRQYYDQGYPQNPPDNRSLVSSVFSPSDVDYRSVWIEQCKGRYAPANHPFYQLDSSKIASHPDDGNNAVDRHLYQPGTWQHLRDIPRFTRSNLPKLSEPEARAFVDWFRGERREGFSNIWSLQKRIDTEMKSVISLESDGQQSKSPRSVRLAPYKPSSVQEGRAIAGKLAITDLGSLVLGRRENSYLTAVWSNYWEQRWESPDAKWFGQERDRFMDRWRYARNESERQAEDEWLRHFQRELDKANKKDAAKFDAMVVDAVVENGTVAEQLLSGVIGQIVEGRVPKLQQQSMDPAPVPRSWKPPTPPAGRKRTSRAYSPSPPPPSHVFSSSHSNTSSYNNSYQNHHSQYNDIGRRGSGGYNSNYYHQRRYRYANHGGSGGGVGGSSSSRYYNI